MSISQPIHVGLEIQANQIVLRCHVTLVKKKKPNFTMAIPSFSSTPFQCLYPTSQQFQVFFHDLPLICPIIAFSKQ